VFFSRCGTRSERRHALETPYSIGRST
jgi:hypothetical protein